MVVESFVEDVESVDQLVLVVEPAHVGIYVGLIQGVPSRYSGQFYVLLLENIWCISEIPSVPRNLWVSSNNH